MKRYALSTKLSFLTKAWLRAVELSPLKAIELSFSSLHEATPARVRRAAEVFNSGKVEFLSFHLPFCPFKELDIVSLDEKQRMEAARRLIIFIEKFKFLQIPEITIHSGGEPNERFSRKGKIESMRRSVSEILPHVKKIAKRLNIELLPRTCIGNSAQELQSITDGFSIEDVGICLDVNHAMGKNRNATYETFDQLAQKIRTIHLSDYDGVDECHWNLGMGVMDIARINKNIKRLDHDVTLILETVPEPLPPIWQSRKIAPEIILKRAVQDIFILENAAELRSRISRMRIGH